MSSKKRDDRPIEEWLRDPGFTPGAKDAAALLRLAGTEEADARAALRALGKIEAPIMVAVRREYASRTHAKGRRALVVLAGERLRRGEPDAARGLIAEALADADPGTRKLAARTSVALGDEALVAAATERAPSDPGVRAALAEAFGMRGDARAGELDDASEDGPRAARARLVAARARLREEASRIRADVALASLESSGASAHVVFRVRAGLEPVLVGELAGIASDARVFAPGRVDARTARSFAELLRARTALDVGLVIETARGGDDDDAALVARALAGERASHALTRLTTGPVRVRVAWADGTKRRKDTWRVAEILREAESAVVSDSRDAPWEAIAFVEPRGLRLELYPALEDDRFAYRVADVPAASHPTIAAALARVAGVVADDVVWDPFVGSGLELCERARLGPYAKLIGTDIDERALERARANLESAGAARYSLIHGDARRTELGPISLVVTNPPMGRRVSRGADLGALLSDVITRASTKLGPKGRIVILSPTPAETARAARNAGLVSSIAMRVDLGGFAAELQRWDIPADAGVRSRSEPGNAARRTSPSQRGPGRGSRR